VCVSPEQLSIADEFAVGKKEREQNEMDGIAIAGGLDESAAASRSVGVTLVPRGLRGRQCAIVPCRSRLSLIRRLLARCFPPPLWRARDE